MITYRNCTDYLQKAFGVSTNPANELSMIKLNKQLMTMSGLAAYDKNSIHKFYSNFSYSL